MHVWDGGSVGEAQQGREGDVPVHLQVHQGLPQLRNRYEVVAPPNQFCEVGLVNATQCHVHSAIEKNGGCNKMVCSYWYVPTRLAWLDGINSDLGSCWQQLHVLLGLHARLEHPQLLLFLVRARASRGDAEVMSYTLSLSIEAIDSIPRPRRSSRPPPASPLRSLPPRSFSLFFAHCCPRSNV